MLKDFLLILILLILVICVHFIYKKRESSKKADNRLSSLKKEFNGVKKESYNEMDDNWIKNRLSKDDDQDLEDMVLEIEE